MTQDERGGLLERRRPGVAGEPKVQTVTRDARNPQRFRPNKSRRGAFAYVVGLVLFLAATTTSWQEFIFGISSGETVANGPCHGYSGVLHIAQGDVEGAAGTIFFMFVLNQLIYADKHNLMPWVHLNNVSHYVYDPKTHGVGPPIRFQMLHGVNASWTGFVDHISQQKVAFPGRPVATQTHLVERQVTVFGNGVWNKYFEPVSRFSPDNPSCAQLPIVRLTHAQIIPALHVNCPWSLRAWRYGGLPPSLRQDDLSYDEWFAPMRKRGNAVVRKYVRFLPHMYRLAHEANPIDNCLALHIRHSDKANRRRRIPVKKFLPYVQAYAQEQHTRGSPFSVYLATDSHKVIEEIQSTWPPDLIAQIQWQDQVVRSNDTTPVFTLSSHHVTNTQVLVDILAMSHCQFLLHGLSAVSEAAHYLNVELHRNKSVNLETPQPPNVGQFHEWVREGRTERS